MRRFLVVIAGLILMAGASTIGINFENKSGQAVTLMVKEIDPTSKLEKAPLKRQVELESEQGWILHIAEGGPLILWKAVSADGTVIDEGRIYNRSGKTHNQIVIQGNNKK